MLWAAEMKKEVDVFVIYTDQRGGPYSGGDSISPTEALQKYREAMNRPQARSVGVEFSTFLAFQQSHRSIIV